MKIFSYLCTVKHLIVKIMDCIKDYVKNYGELKIGFDDDEMTVIDEETRYEFILYEDTIYLK